MCTGRVWKQKETTQHILSTFVLMLHKVKTLCMHIPAREEAHKTLSLHTGQTMHIIIRMCKYNNYRPGLHAAVKWIIIRTLQAVDGGMIV